MNWKTKALFQKAVAMLPSGLGHELYYRIQLLFSSNQMGMLDTNPCRNLAAAAHMVFLLERTGATLEQGRVLEVGTGRRLSLPLGFWLCGVGEILTLDLNPYLKPGLVLGDLTYIRENAQQIRDLFVPFHGRPVFESRMKMLLQFKGDFAAALKLLNVRYLAPADATQLDLPDASFDFHVSSAVLEHIPPAVFTGVLAEAKRILKPGGLLVHLIDFTDHFSYTDPGISAIHCLRFPESEWEWWSGNRFACQNRLRIDDVRALFAGVGLRLLDVELRMDERVREDLMTGFPLDAAFQGKSEDVLATTLAWLVAGKAEGTDPS